MTKTIKIHDVKCPDCGHEFETTKKKNIQCGNKKNNKICGRRFDL